MLLGTHKIVVDTFDCPVCEDKKFVVPVVDGKPQRAVACQCFRQQLDQRQHLSLLKQSQLPIRLQAMTFEACPWRQTLNEQTFNRCRAFAWAPAGWLCLTGSTKRTYLAAAIANVRLQEGLPVHVVTVADFLDSLRRTFDAGGYDETFRAVRACPLLILLDLGYENSTGWSLEKLYQLFQHRTHNDLPLVVTTPVTPSKWDYKLKLLFDQHPNRQTISL